MAHPPESLRSIPSVDEVLAHPRLVAARAEHPRVPWTAIVRAALATLREELAFARAPADRAELTLRAVDEVRGRVAHLVSGGLKPVLNGTGVVLHTNLGRAPVGRRAALAALAALEGYTSLEVDLESGERSKRGDVLEALLCWLTGAEAAMVVNNNAAAVVLVANTFSPPGRVIVSRGELVEIGGSFRLPEILRHAAREVVEVGTTNRTYASDYEREARACDVLLKVHKSNFEIEGFAHEATVAELVAVARARDAHAVFDLGSGALFDFAQRGLGNDPVASAVIETGVDAVTMSGDKLLGGVQAGIIVGRRAFVDRLKQNPLRRAMRVDKVAVAALQEVARAYLFAPSLSDEVPVIAAVSEGRERCRTRAERVAGCVAGAVDARWCVRAVNDDAAVGGGSLASAVVPSSAVVVRGRDDAEAVRLARALRTRTLPVFVRVRGSEIRVNMTTIFPAQEDSLIEALVEVLAARG
ncbi:MAG TPA: L-seryl-tRNA(Sec) selenium transferase [Candidatus Krumholzibacteria bacterium]|nr:L-seryl-tRNA(Sec) selenium transferase [Candidatus Krumholzibacteria bacterium]